MPPLIAATIARARKMRWIMQRRPYLNGTFPGAYIDAFLRGIAHSGEGEYQFGNLTDRLQSQLQPPNLWKSRP
jgi:hypothetical protein